MNKISQIEKTLAQIIQEQNQIKTTIHILKKQQAVAQYKLNALKSKHPSILISSIPENKVNIIKI